MFTVFRFLTMAGLAYLVLARWQDLAVIFNAAVNTLTGMLRLAGGR